MNEGQEYVILKALQQNLLSDRERQVAAKALSGDAAAAQRLSSSIIGREQAGYRP